AGLAVAALRHIEVEPGFLHLRERAVDGEPLDRGDLLADRRAHRRRAGAHGDAVEVDRAGAALRDAAAVFRAGEADVLPQRPEEGRIGLDVDVVGLTVDGESWHLLLPYFCRRFLTGNCGCGARGWRFGRAPRWAGRLACSASKTQSQVLDRDHASG